MPGATNGRIRLAELNDQLTCKLCHGYFIDATTIVECLHSFCKSCIVKYLKSNKYCPICEVQVHECKPLLGIKPDYTLQDIVYKLVPGLYQNEMRCRREFYDKYPEAKIAGMSPEARGEPIESHIYSADELLNLSLEYYNPTYPINGTNFRPTFDEESNDSFKTEKNLSKIYLRCPAAVTVYHLQKLIRAKYELTDAYRIDFMYKEEPLCTKYTLMDVMYIYHWRRKVPLNLNYRIFKPYPKRSALFDEEINSMESSDISNVNQKSNNISRNSKGPLTKKNNNHNNNLSEDTQNNSGVNNVPNLSCNLSQSALEKCTSRHNLVNTKPKNAVKNSRVSVGAKQNLLTTTKNNSVPNSSFKPNLTSSITNSHVTPGTNSNNNNSNSQNNRINNNDSNNNNDNVANNSRNQAESAALKRESLAIRQKNLKEILEQVSNEFSGMSNISASGDQKMNSSVKSTMKKMGMFRPKIHEICAKIRKLSKGKIKVEKPKSSCRKLTKESISLTPSDVVKPVSTISAVHSLYKFTESKASQSKKQSTSVVNSQTAPIPATKVPISAKNSATNVPISAINSASSMTPLSTSIIPSSTTLTPSPSSVISDINRLSQNFNTEMTLNKLKPILDLKKIEKPLEPVNNCQNDQISMPNVNKINKNLGGSRRKAPISKPPRMSKTKSTANYSSSQELIMKPFLDDRNVQGTKEIKNEPDDGLKNSSTAVTTEQNLNLKKILNNFDQKARNAAVSSTNDLPISPMSVSTYSPNQSYQSSSSTSKRASYSLSPKNSSANFLSTNPFIPSSTPNINPNLIYPHYSPPTNSGRFSTPSRSQHVEVSTANLFGLDFLPVFSKMYQDASNMCASTTAFPAGLTIRPVSSTLKKSSPSASSPVDKTSITNSSSTAKTSVSGVSTSLHSVMHQSGGVVHDSRIFNLPNTTCIMSTNASDNKKNTNPFYSSSENSLNSLASMVSMKTSENNDVSLKNQMSFSQIFGNKLEKKADGDQENSRKELEIKVEAPENSIMGEQKKNEKVDSGKGELKNDHLMVFKDKIDVKETNVASKNSTAGNSTAGDHNSNKSTVSPKNG